MQPDPGRRFHTDLGERARSRHAAHDPEFGARMSSTTALSKLRIKSNVCLTKYVVFEEPRINLITNNIDIVLELLLIRGRKFLNFII